MVITEFSNFKISALSVAIPSKKILIEEFYPDFGKEMVDKFSELSGVRQIVRSSAKQTASDLGFIAARQIFDKGNIKKEEIGVLVFVSQKPDFRSPGTAYVLQKRLDLPEDIICLDINLACSGFVYGLQTTLSLLSMAFGKKALLITGDTSYKTMSSQDRTMIMLFGDSGSATIVEKDDKGTSDSFKFTSRTDGQKFKSIITPAGAFRNRHLKPVNEMWSDGIVRSDYNTHMKGMAVFEFSITDVPRLITDFYKKTNTSADNYDYFILHQANLYILKQLSRKCKIPFEKIPISIDRYGNNSSNSIPLVLCDHFSYSSDKYLRLLISGFGAGLSWACGSISINADNIMPIVESDDYYFENLNKI